jgi:hypothetical protein
MTMTRPHSTLTQVTKSLCAFSFTALLAVTATAQIASGTTGIDATGNAASEMAACKNGTTQQSRATCMTEVRNANAAKRAGRIDNSGAQYKANALARCDVLKAEDKVACEARVTGLGNPQGSVAGGGVITEVETVVVPKTPGAVNIQPQTSSDTIVVIPAK